MKEKNYKSTVYDPLSITLKWQAKWEKDKLYRTDLDNPHRPYYTLMMFPYPSAEGLHIGHIYTFSGADAFARFKRMQGYNVFLPIGLDGFGIHSENYALKIGTHPMEQAKITEENFYRQFHATGNSFDWSRKLETNDPNYYKWTQWLFIQMFKNGLAERKRAKVNFCPSCKTVLADEQVIDGKCERCGSVVEKRDLEQWFFKITDYAQRLLNNIPMLDWTEKVKVAQTNWIGKSEGAEVEFKVVIPSEVEGSLANTSARTSREIPPRATLGRNDTIEVFTTRPDTLNGATFLVVAPEHKLVDVILNEAKNPSRTPEKNRAQGAGSFVNTQGDKNIDEIGDYVKRVQNKSEQERLSEEKEKTGVFSGLYGVHPLTGEQLPIWIADYVLGSYGTGAIMAVPSNDERDFEFAKKYNLPIGNVIATLPAGRQDNAKPRNDEAHMAKVISDLEKKGIGKRKSTYHLRDWLISRQRYWGPPIPMIYCGNCAKKGKSWFDSEEAKTIKNLKLKIENLAASDTAAGWYPVSEKDLPLLLPYIEDFKPLGVGVSPLANHPEFYETVCPECGGKARRETDVSDTFLDSSWYFLRYLATDWKDVPFPTESSKFNPSVNSGQGVQSSKLKADIENRAAFLPVTIYIGGAEHSVLHLLYARFVTMFLKDAGYLDFEEPFTKFFAHGLIIKDGMKMSKSKGNVILPDPLIQKFGIDTVRMYLRFLGPFDQNGDFRDTGIEGMHRFVKRIYTLFTKFEIRNSKFEIPGEARLMLHKTIKGVTEDMEGLHFNTAIAKLMTYYNYLSELPEISLDEAKVYLQLIAPFVPHLAEELWERIGQSYSIHTSSWPIYDPALLKEATAILTVQINGKLRDAITYQVEGGFDQDSAEKLARGSEKIKRYLDGQIVKKVIYVQGKLLNFVI